MAYGQPRKQPVRIPVEREALIQAIERQQKKCKEGFAKAGTTEYRRTLVAWRDKAVKVGERDLKKLKDDLAALKKMTPAQLEKAAGSATGLYMSRSGYAPRPPEDKVTDGYATVLRMLRMSKSKSISLTEDQFRKYMDGCPV